NRREETARERCLIDPKRKDWSELAQVWKALPDGDYGNIVRLLILTGQRRDAIGDLRWSEIDQEHEAIHLPGERTKNGKDHTVPLSPLAKSIIDKIPQGQDREFVFGTGAGGFSGWSQSKDRLDAKLKGVKPWRLHDLRRTAATGMAEIGVQPHI